MIKELRKNPKILSRLLEIEQKNFGGEAWNANMLDYIFTSPYVFVYGMYLEDTLIGYCVLSVSYEQGDIDNIVIDDPYKGKGYGKEMLAFMLEQAKKKGVCELFLDVNTANERAISMYRKYGFTVLRTRRNYYENSAYDTNDAYCMLKKL